jgi:hypothetical protein
MTDDIKMSLGRLRFSMSTLDYDRLQKKMAWRWAKVPRIGRKAALQFVGTEPASITFSGVQFQHFMGDPDYDYDIEGIANAGLTHMLTDGRGRVYGKWVITGLNTTDSAILRNGAPLKKSYTLTIQEYGEDYV